MICNPCPKEHTAHPHCSPAGTKAGKQYAFLSGPATGGGRPWRRQQAGNHGRISKKMVKQAEWTEKKKSHLFFIKLQCFISWVISPPFLWVIAFFFFLVFYAHWEVITNQSFLSSHRLQFFYSPPQQRIQGGLSFGNKAAGESRRKRKRALAKQKVTSTGSEVTLDNGRGVGGNFRPQARWVCMRVRGCACVFTRIIWRQHLFPWWPGTKKTDERQTQQTYCQMAGGACYDSAGRRPGVFPLGKWLKLLTLIALKSKRWPRRSALNSSQPRGSWNQSFSLSFS